MIKAYWNNNISVFSLFSDQQIQTVQKYYQSKQNSVVQIDNFFVETSKIEQNYLTKRCIKNENKSTELSLSSVYQINRSELVTFLDHLT